MSSVRSFTGTSVTFVKEILIIFDKYKPLSVGENVTITDDILS